MDVSHSKQKHHYHHQQHVVRWPTDWMHRNRMQLHINNTLPPPLVVPALPLAEPKRSLSSSSSSSTSGRGVAAHTFSSLLAMKSNSVRSSSAPKVSSGQLVSYASRRHCSPCRKLQQHSPQPRRACQPGPTPSPDLLLADKAEWKRTVHDTTYRTYKALPRSSRPFDLKDYALLREIFALAENLTQPAGAEVRLMDVLKAYDMVLQKHTMDPAEDTFYYRMLLKLSLRSEKDWWKRLNQEIVKNDVLLKVTSFRSRKLLLCYWLQWRCHHEKGVLQEKGTRKSNCLEGDNNKNCNGFITKEDKQHSDISKLPASQQHYIKNAWENPKTQSLMSFYNGSLPLQDTVLVMDVVEVPVQGSKSFHDFDFMKITAAFQAWRRVVRQRIKKRNTKEKHALQWRQAVCFNEKNVSEHWWGHWRQLSSKRMIQATLWHDNWFQQKCFSLWSNHCNLMRELCKAGEVFHEKKFCLSVLTEWKNYASSLKALYKDLCKGRAFWGWRRAASFSKRAAQVVHHRQCLTRKKLLLKWRLRSHDVNQHKDALSQCRKYHQVHVLSLCFQGWHDICYQRVKCRRQIAICHDRKYQRYQKIVMQNWHAWIQSKRSLQQVLSIGLLSRAQYLQKETFCIWLAWLKMKQLMERKKLDVSLYQKRRVISKMLCAWERQTSKQKVLKDQQLKALKVYALQLCRKAFCGWTFWQANHVHKINRTITIMEQVCGRQCKRVLQQWRGLADSKKTEGKKGDFAKKRADTYWRVVTAKKCLKAWIELFLNYKAKLQYFTWMKIRMDFHCLHNVLCAWRFSSQQSISQRNHIDYMREHRRMVGLYQRFHVWVWYIQRRKCLRAAQQMHRRCHLKPFFQTWVCKIIRLKFKKEAKETITGHLSKFPEKHKIVNAFLEVCPRWKSYKGFQRWRTWSIDKASKRTQNRRAWEHLARVLYQKALASFQMTLTGAQTLRMSRKHFMVCYQMKAVLAWRTYSMEHAVKKSSKLSAVLYYQKRRQMMVLKKWRLYSLMSQRGDFAKKRADVYWRVVTAKKCLKAWIELFLKYKAKLQYFTWMKIRMDFHCLHNALCAWRFSSQQSISQRNHIDYMREHRRMLCLYQRFHVWVWYIHRRKCLRAAQQMHRRRHLKSFFQTWVCKIIRLKFKKEAKETVKDHIMNKFCRMVFLIWRDVTVMAGHARTTQMLAANKIRQYRMTWAFSKWKEVVKSLNFINETMYTSILRRKLRIFLKWFEVIKMQERWSENHISIVHMRQRRQVRIIFQIWLQKTSKGKREREDNIKALMFERKCTLSRVFRRLKGWMHARQMKEGFSLLACGKLQHVYMKWAFHGWRRQVEIHSRKQAAYHQLQQAWDEHLLAKFFDRMRIITAENWHLRRSAFKAFQLNVVASKVDKVVCLQRQHIFRSLLQYWRKRTISCMALHHNELRFKINLLRRTFSDWRGHTLNKRHLELLERQLSICHSMCLRKQCWTRWQFRTEEAQYKQQFFLFKTFRAWIKYTKWKSFWRCMERDATLIILQSLQKRVLWGWQSLVREIAIRRDEHQQQRFLQREALVIANRTERRQKLESLSGVFEAWKARVQRALSISLFSNKRKQHWKGSIWSNWAYLVIRADCARRVRHEWIRSILQLTLNVWHKAYFMRITELSRKEAEAAQYALWRLKCLVWIQWKSYVDSLKERVKALQDCLALIEVCQNKESVREMICSWKDYTSERTKRREL